MGRFCNIFPSPIPENTKYNLYLYAISNTARIHKAYQLILQYNMERHQWRKLSVYIVAKLDAIAKSYLDNVKFQVFGWRNNVHLALVKLCNVCHKIFPIIYYIANKQKGKNIKLNYLAKWFAIYIYILCCMESGWKAFINNYVNLCMQWAYKNTYAFWFCNTKLLIILHRILWLFHLKLMVEWSQIHQFISSTAINLNIWCHIISSKASVVL